MKKIFQLFTISAVVAILVISSCSKLTTCSVDTGMTTSNITINSAKLSWDSVAGSTYSVQYRVVGTATWQTVSSSKASVTLTALTKNSAYEWQVENICSSTSNSGFSSSTTFNTLDCPTGYEGANCDVKMNAKFAGSYAVNDTGVVTATGVQSFYTYTMVITASSSDPSAVSIANFGGFNPGSSTAATVNGTNITIPNTTIGSVAISNASGTINGNILTFNYTATDVTGTSVDHAVGTK